MVPRVKAYYQALGELPTKYSSAFANALDVLLKERQNWLEHVLDTYQISQDERDLTNVLCGLRDVVYTNDCQGVGQWTADGETSTSLADILRRRLAADGGAADVLVSTATDGQRNSWEGQGRG